jgi:hypothetical protein
MPHQHTDSPDATSQNSVGQRQTPNDRAGNEHSAVKPEPRSYTAYDYREASLAAPAAGEMPDDLDEGEAIGDEFGGGQQGVSNTMREAHSHREDQGEKTIKANRRIVKNGRAD